MICDLCGDDVAFLMCLECVDDKEFKARKQGPIEELEKIIAWNKGFTKSLELELKELVGGKTYGKEI